MSYYTDAKENAQTTAQEFVDMIYESFMDKLLPMIC